MERNQDTIIRAPHEGSFLISGPAGSGKTTVALHRIAYLAQSPDTADMFPGDRCIVFVQDTSARKYFQELLPSLGIKDVIITTFIDWAREILDLEKTTQIHKSTSEDFYMHHRISFEKSLCVQEKQFDNKSHIRNPFTFLKKIYQSFIANKELYKIIKKQLDEKILDTYDLTLLLGAYKHHHGDLKINETYYHKIRGQRNRVEKRVRKKPAQYQSVLIDEFQNYTPSQLELIRSTISTETQTLTYVGDLRQQTHMGSISDWDEIGETFTEDRHVILSQVYRNSPAILNHLQEIGYAVQNHTTKKEPSEDGLHHGSVEIINLDTIQKIKELIKKYQTNNPSHHIGIITFDREITNSFSDIKSSAIHAMHIDEVQGLEFDAVWVLEQPHLFESKPDEENNQFKTMYDALIKDYRYVAYTRAKTHLVRVNFEKRISS